MKPDQILQSDVLDIVFNNRNKAYGAYELRKFYHERLIKALSITSLIVVVFAFISFFKPAMAKGEEKIPVINFVQVSIRETKEQEVKEKPKDVMQKKY
ncbi:MAG: energy transducer TonB [Segetibacter sp.]|nr:energy transducer TonB [Segetibacter sp.]